LGNGSSVLNSRYRHTYLKVSGSNLIWNYGELKKLSNQFYCPMIKANGYGHGDLEILRILKEVGPGYFGVSSVEEGLRLCSVSSDFKFLVFGFHGLASVQAMAEQGLIPVVSSFDQLEALEKWAVNGSSKTTDSLDFHLKFNTGMNRLGFVESEIPEVIQKIQKLNRWRLAGLCMHFHSGENLGSGESSNGQMDLFEKMLGSFSSFSNLKVHAHNSASLKASVSRNLELRYGIRPGLLFYGVHPQEFVESLPLVRPVLSFHSNIVSTQRVKSGGVVSYGGSWSAPRDSLIGIVPAGYADGVRRQISNKGFVLVKGKKVPIVGHVCMDYTMVDLTSLDISSEACVGKEVVFFGHQDDSSISVEDVAGWANCTSWEILTGLSERVPRFYEEEKNGDHPKGKSK